MKITINKQHAIEKLLEDDNAGWSIEGAKVLIEYLEELEEDIGEEMELDVVAIRCDYSEMSIDEILDQYENIKKEFEKRKEDDEEDKNLIKEILSEYTTVIEVDENTVIIQEF